jgi:Flp pilus assembly protein TadG
LERRSAATVVEAAVIMGVFLLLFFGLFEYCRLLYVRQVATNAVRDGARYAVVRTGDSTTTANVQDFVWGQMGCNSNATRLMLANHNNINNPFKRDLTSDSDIRVYRCNAAGNPQPRDANTGVVGTASTNIDSNWNAADWKNARFGDLIAVDCVCKYKPILSGFLFMPSSINLSFKSITASEANN